MKRILRRCYESRVFSLLLLAALLSALSASGAAAPAEPESAPSVLNYQGIVRVDGEPFAGPAGCFKFAIVDAVTGNGTANY